MLLKQQNYKLNDFHCYKERYNVNYDYLEKNCESQQMKQEWQLIYSQNVASQVIEDTIASLEVFRMLLVLRLLYKSERSERLQCFLASTYILWNFVLNVLKPFSVFF
jgi:hypothetical protein